MIRYQDANVTQQKVIQDILQARLRQSKCTKHYRILECHGNLIVRASAYQPPSPKQSVSFGNSMLLLFLNSLLSWKMETMTLQGYLGERVTSKAFVIVHINDKMINEMIGNAAKLKKPEHIDDFIWSQLSDQITTRWERFSVIMQNHLLACVEVKLELSKLSDPQQDQSSCSHSMSFPVRLPLFGGVSNESDKTYDLFDLLAIKDRDPNDITRRRCPFNDQYFSLDQLLPDAVALNELKQQIGAFVANSKERDEIKNTVHRIM